MARPPERRPPASVRRPWVIVGIAAAAIALATVGIVGVHVLSAGAGPGRTAGLGAVSPTPAVAKPASTNSPGPTGTGARSTGSSLQSGVSQCRKPQFVTSDPSGTWTDGGYVLANDMWNISRYSGVAQSLYACGYNNFYVVATMNNDTGDGAVKTYPNVHMAFNEPAISALHYVTSTFAETSPHLGIYEDAYDIWINGVASRGSTELMIWTEDHGQRPGGYLAATASLGGHSYEVWEGGNDTGTYIAFAAESNFTSGTMDLLAFFDWALAQGWLPANSTLGEIDYGAEIASTNGAPAAFTFSNFSVSAG